MSGEWFVKGSQGQTERAVALQEEEEWLVIYNRSGFFKFNIPIKKSAEWMKM